MTVIVAVPIETAVIVPSLTVATELLLVDQVTFLLEALLGDIVAAITLELPTPISILVSLKLTPVTEIVETVILHCAVKVVPASLTVEAVIVVVPAFKPVTTPLLTVATTVFEDDQVMAWFILLGSTVGVN